MDGLAATATGMSRPSARSRDTSVAAHRSPDPARRSGRTVALMLWQTAAITGQETRLRRTAAQQIDSRFPLPNPPRPIKSNIRNANIG